MRSPCRLGVGGGGGGASRQVPDFLPSLRQKALSGGADKLPTLFTFHCSAPALERGRPEPGAVEGGARPPCLGLGRESLGRAGRGGWEAGTLAPSSRVLFAF